MLDGTHWMDKYGDRLLPPCVVDCLWHTVCVGFIICQTENGVSAQNGMEKLGVQCGGTLMTDEGEAWMQVVDHFKKKHTLCAKHFSNKICSAQAGLGGTRRDAFFRDASDLIYANFHTPDHLETKFQIAREVYPQSAPRAFLLHLSKAPLALVIRSLSITPS